MAYKVDAKDLMLTALTTEITHVGAHTGFPATVGNEISGGEPAYARKAINWGDASEGEISASNEPVFDIPGSNTTVAAIGFWSQLASGGTIYADADVTDETFANQGTYTITSATLDLNAE